MIKKLPFRAWYYFRTGYTQYFAFVLAVGNMLTTTYYLAIVQNPAFEHTLSFSLYVIISTIIGVPLLTILGFVHLHKSPIFSTEQDILMESNPYNYHLQPGIQKKVYAPLLRELLILGRKSLSDEKLTPDELKRIEELQKNLEILKSGGSIPKPEKFDRL